LVLDDALPKILIVMLKAATRVTGAIQVIAGIKVLSGRTDASAYVRC